MLQPTHDANCDLSHNDTGRLFRYIRVLSGIFSLTLLGALIPVFFYEGSEFTKYLIKQDAIARSGDLVIAQITENYLFGASHDQTEIELPKDINTANHDNFNWASRLQNYDKCCIVAMLALRLFSTRFTAAFSRHWIFLLLVLPTAYMFLQSYAVVLNGGKGYSQYAIAAHATRWGLGICLMLLYIASTTKLPNVRLRTIQLTTILAVGCTAVTFAIHGGEAFMLNPPFIDLIVSAFGMLSIDQSNAQVHFILRAICVMDLCLAISILFKPHPKVLLWMCFWGALTALSRPLTIGMEAWHEAFIRAANAGMPLLIYFLIKDKSPRQRTETE